MKKNLFIVVIVLLFSHVNYSQNRYTKVSTSTYKPLNYSAFERQAKIKAQNIQEAVMNYALEIANHIEKSNDPIFINDLKDIIPYLSPLYDGTKMSVSRAEWYLKQVKRKYRKAIKNFNKRNRSIH